MTVLSLMIAALGLGAEGASDEPIVVWPVDPLVKVFRDTMPGQAGAVLSLRAARNEYEPAQIAVRSKRDLTGLRIELVPLRHEGGNAAIDGDRFRWNFVGFIPLAKNTRGSDAIRIRPAPCEVPDPLLDTRSMDLKADTTQPVWLTVHVPRDVPAGLYRGEVAVVSGEIRATLPVELTVDDFVLPDERHVWVTNWFNTGNIAQAHNLEPWSEPDWTMLRRYADNMAAHRQNVVLVPWSLIELTREADGKLTFDYGRFDRFVELFEQAGVAERIEISHVGGGKDGWGTEIQLSQVSVRDRGTGQSLKLGTEDGLVPLLADLQRHLDGRGWLAKSMIHVADEPILTNLDSWKTAAALVQRAAPRLRRIEAIETIDCTGDLEVWVPQLIHFDRWRAAYEAHRPHAEYWFYICCNPYGNVFPNRFLDYPLSRVRVLHWLNFSEDLAGYLHWGLNFWGQDPFGTPSDRLPPGDTHVIYPGTQGPLDSIRWEIQRESLEDFEYLHLLATKTAEVQQRLGPAARTLDPRRRAVELSRRVVRAIRDTELDPHRIAAARSQIADEILEIGQAPLVLIQTEPAEHDILVEGPVAVELRGATEPGATVTVNGRPVPVRKDGTCVARTGAEIRVEVQRDGSHKTVTRHFRVQR